MSPLFFHPWPRALTEGRLVRRYNRFLADVALLDGTRVTAHCANTGSMEGLVRPGARVWLSPSDGPRRALPWTWSLIEIDGRLVGVDTLLPNRLVRAMLHARALPRVGAYSTVLPEYPHAMGSRVDFRLQGEGTSHDIEVKNCHLVYPDRRAYFPDGVSARATRHLTILTREVQRGFRASVLFVVQRDDVKAVRPSDLHDPEFGDAARKASRAGVQFRGLQVRPTQDGMEVVGSIPVDLGTYAVARLAQWREDLRPFSGWDRPARTG